MTAEIAIMNKSAVALAADSAVTVGDGNSAKIFNTVNKIFELSEEFPVGIMVSNRLDFMELPLEVLIKEYRRLRRGRSFDTIAIWQNDFVKFLLKEVNFSEEEARDNSKIVIYDAIMRLYAIFQRLLMDSVRKAKFLRSKINGLITKAANSEIRRLKKLSFAKGFTSKNLPDSIIDLALEMIDRQFAMFGVNLSQAAISSVLNYLGYKLAKEELSSYATGFVIAGFGKSELCPSLSHFEIDGIIDGKLKIVMKTYVDIGRSGPEAEVLGFAQDDMVQSFLNGVDPQYREYTQVLVRNAIGEAAKLVAGPILNDEERTVAMVESLSPEFDEMSDRFKQMADEYIERNFTGEIKSMVGSMPMQELATLAESLIEITSLKRKVTRDRETVGGEVDVAMISRSEGLVWVKRKHYFPADLNARFFRRHYKQWRTDNEAAYSSDHGRA